MFFSASSINRCSYAFLICHILIWDCITVSFSSLQVALLFDVSQVLKSHTEVKCHFSSRYFHHDISCALPRLWYCNDITDSKNHHPQAHAQNKQENEPIWSIVSNHEVFNSPKVSCIWIYEVLFLLSQAISPSSSVLPTLTGSSCLGSEPKEGHCSIPSLEKVHGFPKEIQPSWCCLPCSAASGMG